MPTYSHKQMIASAIKILIVLWEECSIIHVLWSRCHFVQSLPDASPSWRSVGNAPGPRLGLPEPHWGVAQDLPGASSPSTADNFTSMMPS